MDNCNCPCKIKSSLSLNDKPLEGKLTNQLSIEGKVILQNNSISSSLSPVEHITGEIEVIKDSISGQLSPINSISGMVSSLRNYPIYDGTTEIFPVAHLDILLETQDTVVPDNIIVHEIPYYETTNLSGGYTVIIG